jgi:RNA recognition motif-containing protein
VQIFVGGLEPNVTEDMLKQVFTPYGEVVYVKIPVGKRCGFVQYSNRLIDFVTYSFVVCVHSFHKFM